MAEAEGLGAAVSPDGGDENTAEGGGVDAVGIALALDAAHHDPRLGPAVRGYLNRQRALVDLQIKHFDEEHTLSIAAARRKAFVDRMRICLQVLVAAIIGGVIIAVVLTLWDAANDRGVVIDAISVPEDLAQRGFTGEVIARRILDRLNEINNTSGTTRAANSYSNSLGGGIKLEIPETGISIGELSRILHENLGHTSHVGGEVIRSGDNLIVRIRLGEEYEVESAGPEATLSALVQDASTKIYARTQPYRYGYWLYSNSESAAAAATFRNLVATGPRIERIWALHGLALVAKSTGDTVRFDRQVLQLVPNFLLPHLTIAQMEVSRGHDEAALLEADTVIASGATGSDSGLSRSGEAELRALAVAIRDQLLGDYRGMEASQTAQGDGVDTERRRLAAWQGDARALMYLHDLDSASDILERLPTPDPPPPVVGQTVAARLTAARLEASYEETQSLFAVSRGDWQGAIPILERIRTLSEMDEGPFAEQSRSIAYPLLAEAYAHTGRITDAVAILGLIAPDDYNGWCVRGRIAMLRHDYAAADQAFAEAVRQAPSIPHAYFEWGNALAAEGDLPGAIARYAEANRRGPHWADPLKAWGDVLVRQGQPHEALKKYRQALPHAPHWPELKTLVGSGSRT